MLKRFVNLCIKTFDNKMELPKMSIVLERTIIFMYQSTMKYFSKFIFNQKALTFWCIQISSFWEIFAILGENLRKTIWSHCSRATRRELKKINKQQIDFFKVSSSKQKQEPRRTLGEKIVFSISPNAPKFNKFITKVDFWL